MRALTVEEARQRATDLAVRSYRLEFDLTGPGDTFVTTSRILFAAGTGTSWVDVKPERLLAVELNGTALDVGLLAEGRFPLTELQADLDQGAMRFYWITPDRCHDTHDCSVAQGDAWLQQTVPSILSSKAFTSGGVLFLTYDEDDGSAGNRVVMVVITNDGVHRTSAVDYNHYSLLATIEDLMGVGRLANAQDATPMTDLLGP